MPSTIYRGDLAEISFGHESGLYFEYNIPASLRFSIQNDASNDSATIKFTAGAAGILVDDAENLLYPTIYQQEQCSLSSLTMKTR